LLKIAVIVGTRPNFIKHYAFSKACIQNDINFFTIHTGQHSDPEMSESLFQELGIRQPEYMFDFKKDLPANDHKQQSEFIEKALSRERPDVTVVFGDVTSSRIGALASAKLSIPVAHVEAGVHTDSLDNPEELNRRVVEMSAHTLFPHTEHALKTLLDAGYSEDNVFLTGDIMKDALLRAASLHQITQEKKGYLLVTVHRAENTDNSARLTKICEALIRSKRKIIFPVHPRTKGAMKRFDLWDRLEKCETITILPPQSYVPMLRLTAGADKVISDSGGLRREAYILGKPVVSLIELNWVPEMVDAGWEWMAGADMEKIQQGIEAFTPPKMQPTIFGDGKAAERIITVLSERYGRRIDRHKKVPSRVLSIENHPLHLAD